MNYKIKNDIILIQELLNLTQDELCKNIEINRSTLSRWNKDESIIKKENCEKLYSFAFKNNIFLNEIKSQFYIEDYSNESNVILFHGAKNEINGDINIKYSKKCNDFGDGFYCGESLEQSALFVSNFENSNVYILKFNKENLNYIKFDVNQDWMLTIAYFRNKLTEYENSPVIKKLLKKIKNVDFIIAPIADNRMFQIIDSFIEGEITDEQCKHALSATHLGYQYVFKTDKAIKQLQILEKCYLCKEEREKYHQKRIDDNKNSDNKIKAAKRQYRQTGRYIDEIL